MSKIPEGYQTVTPYLIIQNAAGFIKFVQNVFNAELINKHMRDEDIIMHAELKVGNCIIMLADSTSQYLPMNIGLFSSTDETAHEKCLKFLSWAREVLSFRNYR